MFSALILPRPVWWRDEFISYNTCLLSIEIEGYAKDIGDTFTPASRQFDTVAAWSAYVCAKYGIPLQRSHHVGHSELTTQKGDPGNDFPWEQLLARVREISTIGAQDTLEQRVAGLEEWAERFHRHTHGEPLSSGGLPLSAPRLLP